MFGFACVCAHQTPDIGEQVYRRWLFSILKLFARKVPTGRLADVALIL